MGVREGGREGEGIIAYKRTFRSPNIEVLKIVCSSNVVMFNLFDTRIGFRDSKSIYSKSVEMNPPLQPI